ncbi:MAG: hypothetical protein AB1413_12515 [Thermodesulfobacteriota bacterium]
MGKLVKVAAACDKCGNFEVVRKRRPVRRDGCPDSDLPQNVVCPKCRMWAKITRVGEV